MNPVISVIIPIYNIEDYLPSCLGSLEKQTFRDFEVIMVDDGSTDGSASAALSFADRDSRFLYVHTPNGGQAAARNRGMNMARGRLFAFVDGDDYVDETYLEKLLDLMTRQDADMAVCGAVRVFGDGKERRNASTVTGNETVTDIHAYLKQMSFCVWSKLFRRELFDGLTFPEGIKFEDFALLPQAVLRAHRVGLMSDALYYYRWRQGSTLNERKVNRDILKAYAVLEDSQVASEYPDVIDAYFVKIVMGSLLWEMLLEKSENMAEAGDIMRKAMEKHPALPSQPMGSLMGWEKAWFGRLLTQGNITGARRAALTADRLKKTARRVRSVLSGEGR